MFSTITLVTVALMFYLLLVAITLIVINLLDYLYCICKPHYKFTDYIPSSRRALLLLPLILPLLLIELVYIATYCTVTKLRIYL